MPAVRRRLLPLCALPLACGVARAQVVAPPEPPPPAPRPALPAPAPSGPLTGEPVPTPPPEPPAGPPAEVPDAVPLTLEAVGRGGRWLVACTARADSDGNARLEVTVGPGGALAGDALKPELFIGARGAEAIDDLLGYDPTGRFVAVRKGKLVELVDVTESARLDLGALGFDDRDDTLSYRQHRALAFDPRGELLAYARATPKRELVLRKLETGEERVVTGLPAEVWRFAWDGTGEQLVVSAIAEDSTNNGRLDWPARLAKRPRLSCQGPIPRFGVSAAYGDKPGTYLVAREAERAEPAPDFVASFGRSWVSRATDGALFVHRGNARKPLASAKCGARILHADPARDLFLVACTAAKNPAKAPVELLAAGSRKELGIAIHPSLIDRWPEEPKRLLPLYPGSESLLVDFERGGTLPLSPGDRVVATSGARALVRRGKRFVLFDADAQREAPLPGEAERLAGVVLQGAYAAVGALVFDLDGGTLRGKVGGRPLALSLTGEALVAEGGAATAERLARGPLRWQVPAGAPAPIARR